MTQHLDLDALQAAAEGAKSYAASFYIPLVAKSHINGLAKLVDVLIDRLRKAEALADESATKALEMATKYESIVQAITDPENQPSQYGTVPLAWLRKAEQEAELYRHLRSIGGKSWTHLKTASKVKDELYDAAVRDDMLRYAPDSTPTDSAAVDHG